MACSYNPDLNESVEISWSVETLKFPFVLMYLKLQNLVLYGNKYGSRFRNQGREEFL